MDRIRRTAKAKTRFMSPTGDERMSNNEILFVGFLCLGSGYLLGRAHAFVKTVFNDVHVQDNKQEIALAYIKNQEPQIEQSIKKIDAVLAEIIEQMEAKK